MEPKLEFIPRLRFTDENGQPYPEWEEKKLGELGFRIRTGKKDANEGNPFGKYDFYTCSAQKSKIDTFAFTGPALTIPGNGIIGEVNYATGAFDAYQRVYVVDDIYDQSILYLQKIISRNLQAVLAKEQMGSTLKYIRLSTLTDLSLPLPYLPEQEKIGEFLSALDAEVEQAERLVSLLSDRKRAYTQRIFDRTLRFHDDNGNPYPEWEEKKLGDVSEINPNGDIPESFTYIDLESVKKGSIILVNTILKAEAPSRAKRLVNTNDILYSTVRPYQMNNVHIDESHNGSVASTGFAVLRVNGVVVSDFLYSVVNSDMFYSKIEKACVGGTYPTINTYDLGQTLVPLPSLPEQEKIGSFLSALDDEIDEAKRELELLKERKRAYTQRIFGV